MVIDDLDFIFVRGINRQTVAGKIFHHESYEGLDDKELLDRLRNNDRGAFSYIYGKYNAELYTFAMRYLKNRHDVEDVIQHVFVKFWTIREALFVNSNLRAYLYAMTRHQIMNFIRNSNNILQHNYKITQQQPKYDDDLYTYAERNHLTELLAVAIKALPPQQRTVAALRCEGYSNQEIAQKMNLSIHTVNTHYRTCLKALKAHFASMLKFLIFYLLIRL